MLTGSALTSLDRITVSSTCGLIRTSNCPSHAAQPGCSLVVAAAGSKSTPEMPPDRCGVSGKQSPGTKSRMTPVLSFAPDATSQSIILVVDIGGTNVKFGFVQNDGPHSYQRLYPTEALRAGDPVEALAAMVQEVVAQSGLSPDVIVSTVPGFIDTDLDRVLYAGNILALNGRALASDWSRLSGYPVLLERDAILMLTGEVMAGVAQDAAGVLGVFFGTGIGAAYLQKGVPFRGDGWALEIGHMPVRGEGRRFAGMRTDCLEAYASGRALEDLARHHGETAETVFRAADGKPALQAALDQFVRDQAFGVATAVAMLSPGTIVLGGGVLNIDGYPRNTLSALIAAHAPISETGRPMDLRWAAHGWSSVLYGAPRVVAERQQHLPPPIFAPV